MDDHRPLFSTFKPISEDNMASAKPGPDMTLVQPWGEEQSLGHQDTHSRVGRGAAMGPSPSARHPSVPELTHLQRPCPLGLHQEPRAGTEHP